MPLVVLTRGRPAVPGAAFVEQDERLWVELQRELARLVPGSRHLITRAATTSSSRSPSWSWTPSATSSKR
jgi:hypothetical protein